MSRQLVRQQPLRPLKVKITVYETVGYGDKETGITYETSLETSSLPDLIVRMRKMMTEINTPIVVEKAEEPRVEAKATDVDTNPEPKEVCHVV